MWIEATSERLLQGDRLYSVFLPHFGATQLASEVAQMLGQTCIQVDGKSFTEANQEELRDRLISDVTRSVEKYGSAQLIFDNYHAALKRTKGGRLQAALVALLIDGQLARDVGALLLARLSGRIHLDTNGSPLLSRSAAWALPRIIESDLPPGADIDAARRQWGHISIPMGLYSSHLDDDAYTDRMSSLRASASFIAADVSFAARETILGRVDSIHLSRGELDAAEAFTSHGVASHLARESGIMLMIDKPEIPVESALSDRVQTFSQLIGQADRVLWCDRYLFVDVPRLVDFIRKLRRLTGAELCLLAMQSTGDGRSLATADLTALRSVPGVKYRFIQESDFRLLHDRHLVHFASGSGYVLSTARVMLGIDPVGSSVITRASSFGVDYSAVWNHSSNR